MFPSVRTPGRSPGPAARPMPAERRDRSPIVVPYEHAAVFPLTGRPGNVVQDVITVNPDGVFVAVAIGYGFDEDRGRQVSLRIPSPAKTSLPGAVQLRSIPVATLIEGFRFNPRADAVVFEPSAAGAPRREPVLSSRKVVNQWLADNLLERVKAPEQISFLFSMLDSATGRELSDQPAHNLASLGSVTGERPFRPLSRPLAFLPRSTLRVQVIENSIDVTGQLHVVLFGYMLLGSTTCSEGDLRALAVSSPPPVPGPAQPHAGVIPFDYVMKFPLTGRAGNRVVDEIAVNAEGGFVADAIGYGLVPDARGVPLTEGAREAGLLVDPVDLATLPLSAFPTGALVEGVRVRPGFQRIVFDPGGTLASIPPLLLDQIFERLNRADDVRFLYTLTDSGLGRELQNRPIHNIAGLGIANGDRPFKRLAQPLVFLPRSTLRAEVEERFGRGTLFITLQGYRVVGATLRSTKS